MASTTRKSEYAPLPLSARTVATIPLSIKITDGSEPWPTICLLGRLLVKIHDLRCAVSHTELGRSFAVAPILITHPGRRDENNIAIPDPHIHGVERVGSDPKLDHRKLNRTDIETVMDELIDYTTDSITVSDRLDALVRESVPALSDHTQYIVVTSGVDKVSGYRLEHQPTRQFVV